MPQPHKIKRDKSWRAWTVAFLVALVCGELAAPARGAEDDKIAARAHYESGTRLYEVQDYGKALEEYKAAYLAKPDPAFLYNMGQCYRKLDKSSQALELYREYLKKIPPGDPNRADVEAKVKEIDAASVFEATSRLAVPPTQTTPSLLPSVATQPAGLDLTAGAQAETVTKGTDAKPFYGTWWFWTGVGAVVVAGTVTAVALATGGSKTNSASTALGTQVFQ